MSFNFLDDEVSEASVACFGFSLFCLGSVLPRQCSVSKSWDGFPVLPPYVQRGKLLANMWRALRGERLNCGIRLLVCAILLIPQVERANKELAQLDRQCSCSVQSASRLEWSWNSGATWIETKV